MTAALPLTLNIHGYVDAYVIFTKAHLDAGNVTDAVKPI